MPCCQGITLHVEASTQIPSVFGGILIEPKNPREFEKQNACTYRCFVFQNVTHRYSSYDTNGYPLNTHSVSQDKFFKKRNKTQ